MDILIGLYLQERALHESDLVTTHFAMNLIKDSISKQKQSKIKKVSLPQMKRVYTPTIRSIDLTELIHPSGKHKHFENALDTFLTENPCLQTVMLSCPKLPNYLLKHLVDTCVDLRELTLVGCHVIDAEHIRYVGSRSKKLTKLELNSKMYAKGLLTFEKLYFHNGTFFKYDILNI